MIKKFPNLNSLRFFAAFLVIICHTEQLKSLLNFPNYFESSFIYEVGKLGVVLFFSLSGFLITYLLLNERHIKSKINLKNFYMRRVLRIWPLYYLIVLLSFFIFPFFKIFELHPYTLSFEKFPTETFLSYIFILPNLATSILDVIPYASQAWSIGTEEQFYLIWPLIFIFIRKGILQTMFAIIIVYITIHFLLHNYHSPLTNKILSFWKLFNIDCMAIGGIIAYLEFYKSSVLRYLKNNIIFLLSSISAIACISLGINFGLLNYEIYAILFSVIILNLACNDRFSNVLENKILNFLGNISYGIYMYHTICIVVSIKMLAYFNFLNYFSLYICILSSTVIISYLSYKFLEKPFLNIKSKF